MAATGLVGISTAVYLFQLLCFIIPVNRHKMFRNGSLLGTEPLKGLNECWKSGSTAKLAQTALNKFAARAVNMASNHKVKLSKHTTPALTYYLCLSLLLSSGNVESISQNRNFKLSTVKGLRIFHLNVRSLVSKIDEMRVFCETHRPHVLSLNETWLDSSISDSEIQLPGYSLVRRDKTRRNGGLIYVSSNLDYKVIQEFDCLKSAEDLRSIHRSSARSFSKWLPQIDRPEKFNLRKTTVSEVSKALKDLKPKKATGVDDIPSRLLKDGSDALASPLSVIFNLTIQQNVIPAEWKKAKVTPLHKSVQKMTQEITTPYPYYQ